MFLSLDGGLRWDRVTDPINPGASGKPHIPRPREAHFDHYAIGRVHVYLGTQGRGVWRISFQKSEPYYKYSAKMVCGVQKDGNVLRLARGFYATTINVHNPGEATVLPEMKLAVSFPAKVTSVLVGELRPLVFLGGAPTLGPDEALRLDCSDVNISGRVNGIPATAPPFSTAPLLISPYFEGFLVIQSRQSLEVVGVYSTADIVSSGPFLDDYEASGHSSIDVEHVPGRLITGVGTSPSSDGGDQETRCPDLTVRNIDSPSVNCPTGDGSCVTRTRVSIANAGNAHAGAFDIQVVFDPGQTVVVNRSASAGLTAQSTREMAVVTPPGGNCFDTDCTICVFVDSTQSVQECRENNNRLCKEFPG